MIGQDLQNYRIVQLIGKGGMATVYKAQHKSLDGVFAAIKVLNPALATDEVIRQKFRKEAQLMSTFSHPNIARVTDYAEDERHLYLIMDFVEGPTLEEMIRRHTGPIVEPRAKKLLSQILDGVGYAHEKGVIHRDLKPSNILISPGDIPKIIDFGIVKMLQDEGHPGATKTGQIIGTPMFMSPEQIIGRGIDARADIYALGITLFEMLTGHLPYNIDDLSLFEIQQKIISEPLPRATAFYAGVKPQMQQIIDIAAAKDKQNRFADCAAFRTALNLGAEPVSKMPEAAAAIPLKAPQPIIRRFNASATKVKKGQPVVLTWDTHATDEIELYPVGTTRDAKGTYTLLPTESTTYFLRAGGEQAQLHVEVKKGASVLRIILVTLGILLAILFLIGLIAEMTDQNSDGSEKETESSSPSTTSSVPENNSAPTSAPEIASKRRPNTYTPSKVEKPVISSPIQQKSTTWERRETGKEILPEAKSNTEDEEIPAENDRIRVWAEQMPEFNGNLNEYLADNIRYPASARRSGSEGRVVIKFVVDENGRIDEAFVEHGVNSALDAEALRVIRRMPRWRPGMQNGKPVRVYFRVPIKFTLED